MAGLIVAALLLASLLVVHVSLQRQPLPATEPLNVDLGLPLPEVGQASTVFSLSALFGGYLGLYLLLGVPALFGLATGTVVALLLLRRWIDAQQPESFEDYLLHVLGTNPTNATAFALGLAALQCAFATSEMVILRSFAGASLGLRADHANLLVVTLAVIAYFYVLFGGYLAVFRTDLVQFSFVAAMGLVLLGVLAFQGVERGWNVPVTPRAGYWTLPFLSNRPLLYSYQFVISGMMGMGFLLVSPDAWKRVYLVSRSRRASSTRFAIFVVVGVAPFVMLIPISAAMRAIPDGAIDAQGMWAGAALNEGLFIVTCLCLVASFLSAYNGALVASVHIGLIAKRQAERVAMEMSRFYWLMISALFTIVFLFGAMNSFGNPYMLGNLLLGPYAILAGISLAGWGSINTLPPKRIAWVLIIGLVSWFFYFIPRGLTNAPSTYQINTVPTAGLLLLLALIVCRLPATRRGSRA